MIKFLNKNIFKFKPSINSSYVQFSSTNNSDKNTKSNFELKIDEDCLDDEDLNYLSDRELKVESETDKLKAIKTLVDENFSLKKENGKLKYRIEHLLLTINSLEEKINTNKI
jgi:hypothetical protein